MQVKERRQSEQQTGMTIEINSNTTLFLPHQKNNVNEIFIVGRSCFC